MFFNWFGYGLPAKKERKHGWIKDNEDDRDRKHFFVISPCQHFVKKIDLRDRCPPIYDQGNLGSCTANAIAGAYEFDMIKEEEKEIFTPSRLFIYYNEREMEGTVGEDSGAQIRDGIKSINKIGVCPEIMWPYDVENLTLKPMESCYNDAVDHKSIMYRRVRQNLEQMKQCLMEGFPFVFGFVVYESFDSEQAAKTGIIPMPKPGEQVVGGHAVMAVGFDTEKNWFIVRNSWGVDWGDQGYCYMPFEYLTNSDYASDFWTIERVRDL